MMNRSRTKLNVNLIVQLLLIWFIFQSVISSSLLKHSNYASVFTLIRDFSLIVRLFMIVFGSFYITRRKIEKKYLVVLFIYALILLVTKVYNDSWQFFDALFIALLFKDEISREQIISLFLRTIIVSCSIVILAYFVGVFPHYAVIRFGGRERIYLGFAHPNTLGYYSMICSFLFVLAIKERINYLHIALLIAVAYWVYVYPNSFTSSISILLLAVYILVNKVYFFLFKKNVVKSNLIRIASIILVPSIIILVFWFVSNSANSLYADDTLRTFYSRFRLGSQAIQQYGIHLFGSRDIEFVGTAAIYFEKTGKKYFTVDCFYIQLLVKYGIVPSLFFFVYYISCIKATLRERDSDILVILVILAFYSISESMILAVPTSFVFIISSQYIFKRRKSVVRKNTTIPSFSAGFAEKRI